MQAGWLAGCPLAISKWFSIFSRIICYHKGIEKEILIGFCKSPFFPPSLQPYVTTAFGRNALSASQDLDRIQDRADKTSAELRRTEAELRVTRVSSFRRTRAFIVFFTRLNVKTNSKYWLEKILVVLNFWVFDFCKYRLIHVPTYSSSNKTIPIHFSLNATSTTTGEIQTYPLFVYLIVF